MKDKYYVLDVDYRNPIHVFDISELESANEEDAWEEIEEGYATNLGTQVLLTEQSLRELRDKLLVLPLPVKDKSEIVEERLTNEGFNFADVREFMDEHYQNLNTVEQNIELFKEWVSIETE